MKKLSITLATVLLLIIVSVLDIKAQNNVGGILIEAKGELLAHKNELLIGRNNFVIRIKSIRDSVSQSSQNNQRIAALNSGINDIDSTIKKIDIAIDAIDNCGIINDYSNRIEINRNNNFVKIYKRVNESKVTVIVNGENILTGKNEEQPINIDITTKNTKKEFNGHLSGLFLGVNGLLRSDGKYETPESMPFFELNEGRSLDFSIFLNDLSVPFSKNCGLVIDAAFQFNHYSFQQVFDLKVVDHQVTADYDNTISDKFKRYNYRIIHFNVPLVFEFCTTGENKFFINAGIMGGIRIGSRTKQIYKTDGDRHKNRVRNTFDTNLLKYSFVGGIGYRGWQVFGEYSPVPLFKSGHAEKLYPFSLGIKWTL